jgi:hypothetical protein
VAFTIDLPLTRRPSLCDETGVTARIARQIVADDTRPLRFDQSEDAAGHSPPALDGLKPLAG